jgi:hypothetical protein
MLTREALEREAAATGFRTEPLEKAIRLLELLESLQRHPFLAGRTALKGGTALNLFVLDAPRLSVDVDLNYIGAADRDTMLADRPKVEQAIRAVCGRLGIRVRRVPTEHAGGKWRLSYIGAGGRSGTLELDVSFLVRTPLWPPIHANSQRIGSFVARRIPILDMHELAAGKLAALFSRRASRDLFDACSLLRESRLDRERLRFGFVVYGGASRRDWREVTLDDIRVDLRDVEQQLLPVLRADLAPASSEIRSWSEGLAAECRNLLSGVLPLSIPEMEFLAYLNERGEIVPELLTDDAAMQAIIRSHPGLLWKAENVRDHRGLTRPERGA